MPTKLAPAHTAFPAPAGRSHDELIIDSVPGLVAILSPGGDVDAVNNRVVEYCGQPLHAMRHWATNGTMHVDDVPRIAPVFRSAIVAGIPYDFVARIRRRDGVYRWFQVRGHPLRGADGTIARWYELLTDVDDLKRTQEELRRDKAFLAKVQRLSATGGFYWWPDTGEAYWSEQVYRIFEVDPSQPLTPELRQSRIHPDDLPGHQETIRKILLDPHDFEYEVRLVMPNKTIKYVHSLVQATYDSAGSLLLVGAIQDVTQRRLSEFALLKVRSELGHLARVATLSTLTASIAHEVNQPLSGIITNASTCLRMLGTDSPNLDGARETARRTIRDGQRAAEIIAKLRALYGKQEAARTPVDLNDAAREVIAVQLGDLHNNHVVVRTELAPELPMILGDRMQLQQVVWNLVRNASESMRDGEAGSRELLVKTWRDLAEVYLSVRDTGPGLPPDTADRLFTPFFTTKQNGMGMGLSVSRAIIARHQGRLWATPNHDRGVTFTFSIPCDTKV